MTAREKAVSEAMTDIHTSVLPLELALDLVYGLGRLDAAKIIKNSDEDVDVSVAGIAFEEYLKSIDSEGI